MITKEELIENYQKFDDDKIITLAMHESKSLTDETIPILENEIIKRNLDRKLIEWIKLERNFIKDSELEILKNKIKDSKCSECGNKYSNVMGFDICYRSFLDTRFDAKLIICENCGKKLRIKNYFITITLGWLSFRGLLRVPLFFIDEFMKMFSREKTSNEIIDVFIQENTGLIREYGFDRIEDLIAQSNLAQLNDDAQID